MCLASMAAAGNGASACGRAPNAGVNDMDAGLPTASTLSGMVERPGWASLPALRKQQVCLLDNDRMDLLSRPGPRLGEAAHMLADCLRALPSVAR